MRWFFLLLATIAFLCGACGHAAVCNYALICSGGSVGPPTYLAGSCTYFKWNAQMVGQADLYNDLGIYATRTSAKYSQRLQLYDTATPNNLIADSTEHEAAFACDISPGCDLTHHHVTITTTTTSCQCFSNTTYYSLYTVGDLWDPNNGYNYVTYESLNATSPPPR